MLLLKVVPTFESQQEIFKYNHLNGSCLAVFHNKAVCVSTFQNGNCADYSIFQQASDFSLQYHYLIKHRGHENNGNDQQRKKYLDVAQFLSTCIIKK